MGYVNKGNQGVNVYRIYPKYSETATSYQIVLKIEQVQFITRCCV